MKRKSWFLGAIFVGAGFASLPSTAAPGFMIPVEGRAVSNGVCGLDGQTWTFIATFKPIVYKGSPWKDYIVQGAKCGAVETKCTDSQCAAAITGCSVRVSGSYAGVIAKGFPERASSVRIGTAFKPKDCPVKKLP